MSIALADRVHRVKPSATLAINARANQLKAQGKNIISLGVGEPDFPTPEAIQAAAIKAMHDGKTRYTAVEGTIELRQAICRKLRRDNQLEYTPDQILVSNGAKHSIYNLCQALLNPGDEVLIPAPYWVSYPDMVLLAEGTPKFIETTQATHFKLTPSQLSNAITAKTRLLVLNSPSNPTGVAYTAQELQALGDVLAQHPHVLVLSDDIYEHIYWGQQPFSNIVTAVPALYDRTIVINGVSKAYAMTGWRIGYAAGYKPLIAEMEKIQSQSTSNPCSISQAAALAALDGDQRCVQDMTKVFRQRHDAVLAMVRELPGIECVAADGAFYLFPYVQHALAKLKLNSDVAFAEHLLNHAGVAVVPGSAFGSPGYMRLSFATDMNTLTDAMTRIKAAL